MCLFFALFLQALSPTPPLPQVNAARVRRQAWRHHEQGAKGAVDLIGLVAVAAPWTGLPRRQAECQHQERQQQQQRRRRRRALAAVRAHPLGRGWSGGAAAVNTALAQGATKAESRLMGSSNNREPQQ